MRILKFPKFQNPALARTGPEPGRVLARQSGSCEECKNVKIGYFSYFGPGPGGQGPKAGRPWPARPPAPFARSSKKINKKTQNASEFRSRWGSISPTRRRVPAKQSHIQNGGLPLGGNPKGCRYVSFVFRSWGNVDFSKVPPGAKRRRGTEEEENLPSSQTK